MLRAQNEVKERGGRMVLTLKGARANAGFKQSEVVAELKRRGCKISKNTLINYEKGRTIPDIETAKALAALYGTTVDNIKFS